jgi:hypothetical protein
MDEFLHVRRCHVCGLVTESTNDILKCGGCNKSLLPFYYFDKRKVKEYADNEKRVVEVVPAAREQGAYGPIRGLTAYW